MLGTLGWQELLLVLLIVSLIAGGGRVADLGGSLGRGLREFRAGLRDEATLSGSEADSEPDSPPEGADGGAIHSPGVASPSERREPDEEADSGAP